MGGFGAVYTRMVDGREVAVKTQKGSGNSEKMRESFLREVRFAEQVTEEELEEVARSWGRWWEEEDSALAEELQKFNDGDEESESADVSSQGYPKSAAISTTAGSVATHTLAALLGRRELTNLLKDTVKIPSGGEIPSGLWASRVARMSDFANPLFWSLNLTFPNLVPLIHDIFVVFNLLSKSQCERLMREAKPYLHDRSGNNTQTGGKLARLPLEIPIVEEVQAQFMCLLNMPIEHFEPLKVTAGGSQRGHPDASETPSDRPKHCPSQEYAARVVTLFVYLTDDDAGNGRGDTNFMRAGLSFTPKQGMGVIHFPSYNDTHPDNKKKGARNVSMNHEVKEASAKRAVAVQFGWNGALVRDKLPEAYRPSSKRKDA